MKTLKQLCLWFTIIFVANLTYFIDEPIVSNKWVALLVALCGYAGYCIADRLEERGE